MALLLTVCAAVMSGTLCAAAEDDVPAVCDGDDGSVPGALYNVHEEDAVYSLSGNKYSFSAVSVKPK